MIDKRLKFGLSSIVELMLVSIVSFVFALQTVPYDRRSCGTHENFCLLSFGDESWVAFLLGFVLFANVIVLPILCVGIMTLKYAKADRPWFREMKLRFWIAVSALGTLALALYPLRV